jgi:hypothetical protein
MARTLTEDFIGTCQWCFGEYKTNSKKLVVLHGYARPGYGYTIGQCSGVGHAPFEYSHELTDKRVEMLKSEIANGKDTLKKIDSGKVNKVPNPNYLTPAELEKKRTSRWWQEPTENLEYFTRDHKRFEGVLHRLRANVESRLNYDERTLVQFEKLIAEWKRGQITGIDIPATNIKREMRDAYDPDKVAAKAEREAAKAVRDAKPGKINITLYRYGKSQFHHLGAGNDSTEADWAERMTALEGHYAEEKSFKASVKAWAKATFPGKVWVGDAYSGDYERYDRSVRGGAWVSVNLKVEWQYLNDVEAMFPKGEFVHRDDRGPKDVRLIVRGEAFPDDLK